MKKLLRNLLFPTLLSLLFIISNSAEGLRLDVYNRSTGVSYSYMIIGHILGATEGDDGNYDLPDNSGGYPNILNIYSHNYSNDIDYFIDARGSNSTTTYNLELLNKGFSGTANNMLRFVMVVDSNFKWKNIFLGDFNDSNDIVADIKYVIAHGGVYPSGTHYGDFPLPDLEGSNVGVYDKRKVLFFNHADFNRDRRVNGLDFAIFARNWGGNEETDPNTFGAIVGYDVNDLDAYSDIDRNGRVDCNDLSLFSGEWLWDANDPNTWSRVR